MEFSLNRNYLATGDEDGVIYIWKVRNVTEEEWRENQDESFFDEEPLCVFQGHTVRQLFLSPEELIC